MANLGFWNNTYAIKHDLAGPAVENFQDCRRLVGLICFLQGTPTTTEVLYTVLDNTTLRVSAHYG